MKSHLLAVCVAMCACAQGMQLSGAEAFIDEPCGMSFAPASELLEATQRAAKRWSTATGCNVRVESGGVPVVVLPEVIDSSGKPTRARTTTIWVDGKLQTDRTEYRSDSLNQADRIIPHEMGHALGGYGHTEQGLMQEAPKLGESIDADSLALVCKVLRCSVFRPEI